MKFGKALCSANSAVLLLHTHGRQEQEASHTRLKPVSNQRRLHEEEESCTQITGCQGSDRDLHRIKSPIFRNSWKEISKTCSGGDEHRGWIMNDMMLEIWLFVKPEYISFSFASCLQSIESFCYQRSEEFIYRVYNWPLNRFLYATVFSHVFIDEDFVLRERNLGTPGKKNRRKYSIRDNEGHS